MGRKRWLFGKVNQITIEDFKTLQKRRHQVVDLRGASEYNAGHIKGADNVFVGTYLTR
jgi:hydroxyacylglutathione hydrolase